MLSSEPFEVTITGTHAVHIPAFYMLPFIEAGHKRIKLLASFKNRELVFYGAIRKYKGVYLMSFGKRYQKEMGIDKADYFRLQLFENDTKYGVEMPEEFQAVLESDPQAAEGFERLTDGKKRSLIYYIARFKSSQLKIDKALIITENIKLGITDGRELIKDRR